MQVLDGERKSKWLDFGAAGGKPAWLELDLPEPRLVTGYAVRSAGDEPARDPCSFSLEGVVGQAICDVAAAPGSGEDITWTVLDAQDGVVFSTRQQQQQYQVRVAS